MRNILLITTLCFVAAGCASKPPVAPPPLEYREIPEGFLQPCELPAAPTNTGELSEAFVIAFQCAEQGNRDKQRIRDLTNAPE